MPTPSVLQRYNDLAGVQALGDLWTVSKAGVSLRCVLSTHQLGWELRAISGVELARSRVCKTDGEVFATADAWRREATEKGWTEEPDVTP